MNRANRKFLPFMLSCTNQPYACNKCVSSRTHESGQRHRQWQGRLAALVNGKQRQSELRLIKFLGCHHQTARYTSSPLLVRIFQVRGEQSSGSILNGKLIHSAFLTMFAELHSASDTFGMHFPRRCEEPLETLTVTNQVSSKFLAMHV